eukprot:GHRQ01022521.1.p1 GENE.GHRQ01022521.1~~GHRQ01022521.1.p1  ORF type:complete len:124 (-),score=52.30 GHRQ01022521.1:1234-1569(-)
MACLPACFLRCMQAAFNLLVCSYALGDAERMMAAFQRLLAVPGLADSQEEDEEGQEEDTDMDKAASQEQEEGLGTGLTSLKQRFMDGLPNGAGSSDQMKREQKQQQASITK